MRLLLTSGGVKNQALTAALLLLANKPAKELKVAFVPTAANVEVEDKTWLVDNLRELRDMQFAWLDIIDIAALPLEQSHARLQNMDIIVFGGGRTEYLIENIRKAKLESKLLEWTATKVFVGISAGSVMMGQIINPRKDKGLGWVDFLVVPHKDAPYANRTADQVKTISDNLHKTVYWLSDDAAVMVSGEKVELVGDNYEVL